MVKHFTTSPRQTKKLAEILAKKILKTPQKKRAFVLRLEGDLGGGKTTFLQGLARGLGIYEKVLSPTFVIIRKFQLPKPKLKTRPKSQMSEFRYFYHIDCYRVKKQKEVLDLGFKEIISNPENIVAIEWAERVRKLLPKKATKIKFKFINKHTRKLTIQGDCFNLPENVLGL